MKAKYSYKIGKRIENIAEKRINQSLKQLEEFLINILN